MRTLGRLVAVFLLTAVSVLTTVVGTAPAHAAACSSASGVTVVVDFQQLGGGIRQDCAAGSGSAATLAAAVGLSLTRVQREPGFVCRVEQAPASDPCVVVPPATAYWSLWWSDGTSPSWSYASFGVDSLQVPSGGSLAFSWNQGSGRASPGAPAATRATAPTASTPSTPLGKPSGPSSSPSPGPSSDDTGGAATGRTLGDRAAGPKTGPRPAASATTTPTDAAAPSAKPSTPANPATDPARPRDSHTSPDGADSTASTGGARTPRTSPSPTQGTDGPVVAPATDIATAAGVAPTSSARSPNNDRLPTWVPLGAAGLLFAAAGTVAAVRRRRRAG